MRTALTALIGGTMILAGGLAFAGGSAPWGYSGEEGPENWGSLSAEYGICGSGKNQSPIDIRNTIEAPLEGIAFSYQPTALDCVNNGHTVKASCAPGSEMTIEGTTYKLLQFHFHTPSENMINGESFPMEVHLVHADADGNLAVVGVMFREGAENPVVTSIWDRIPKAKGETVKDEGVQLSAADLLPANQEYYRFNGSLTTPPCSEGVKWFVMKEAVEASAQQVKQFTEAMHGPTNRPVQSANARPVLM